jgi:hypothetical protein
MTEEDESFNEIERRSKVKQTLVKSVISTNPYRNQVIEEIAQHVEDCGFLYEIAKAIREMKE